MKKTNVVCVAAILLMASLAGAADIGWVAMDDGIGPQDEANWNDPANWTLERIPTADDKVKFYSGTAVCVIDSSVVGGQLVMGDNGSATTPEENFIHIKDGGTLTLGTSSSWSAIGYNRPAKMVIDKGGTWDNGNDHFWIGFQSGSGGSILEVNGGTVKNVNNAMQLGRSGGGIDVYLNSGLIAIERFAGDLIDEADTSGSSFDIKFGTFRIHRTNLDASIAKQIAAGLITAFGEQGDDGAGAEIVYAEAGGYTTLTATDPMEASPAYGEEEIYFEDVTLSWKSMDPNNAGSPLVNVWIGQLEEGATEPNRLGPLFKQVIENEPWSEYMSVLVGEFDEQTGKYFLGVGEYYWQVELVNLPVPDLPSPWYHFTTTDNRTPWNVSAGADIHTWIDEATPLAGSYGDESIPDILWTSDDPNAVFSPSDDGGVTSAAINPAVTVDYAAGAVTLTLTVDDGVNPAVSDDVTITVWNDACDATRNGAGGAANYPGDFTGDCRIDFADLAAEIAAKWLDNYALPEPIAVP